MKNQDFIVNENYWIVDTRLISLHMIQTDVEKSQPMYSQCIISNEDYLLFICADNNTTIRINTEDFGYLKVFDSKDSSITYWNKLMQKCIDDLDKVYSNCLNIVNNQLISYENEIT